MSIPGGGYSPPPPPSGASGDEVARYDAYVASIKAAINEANTYSRGWEKLKLESELEDAEKGRANAIELQRMREESSRYGVDIQRKTRLDELEQNQRQFDSTHALDMQRFGLDVAKAYTEYASGPDTLFMMGDFREGLARAGQGLAPSAYGQPGGQPTQPTPRGWQDFAALAGFGGVPAVQAATGGGAPAAAPSGGGAGAGADPRVSAASAVMRAIPPSAGQGLDADDWAALSAVENVFRASKPGTLERMRPGQQKAFSAGLSRLGYYAPDAISEMRRAAPGQQSSRLA